MTGEIFNAGNLGELQQAHTYEEADEAKENFESTCVVSDILATIQDTQEKIPIAEEPPSLVNRMPTQASLRGTRNDQPWLCPASEKSQRTVNPIRAIVDPIIKNIETGEQREDGKDLISLALGDPTVGGNLPPCIQAIEGVIGNVKTPPHRAGYVNACGDSQARKAIARYHSYPQHQINADNVIVANGCSGALELALTTLLDPGTLLLVPQPGFPLYQVIAQSHGAATLPYQLDPDLCWEIDLGHLESLLLKYPPGEAQNHN